MRLENGTNYYEILEISSDATQDEIKKAFRKLAKRYHPDVNPNAHDMMSKITVAYEVLSDVEKRKEYDRKHPFVSRFEESKSCYSYNQSKDESESDLEDWIIDLLKEFRVYNAKDNEMVKLYKAREIFLQAKHFNSIFSTSELIKPKNHH